MTTIRNIDPEVTWEDVKRSRHTRRRCLHKQRHLLDGGWERLSGVPFYFAEAFKTMYPECYQRASTFYNDRRKPSRNDMEDWFLSPKMGISAQEIFQTAVDEYVNDPEEKYRPAYQMRLILQMPVEEIQTLYMMHRLGS